MAVCSWFHHHLARVPIELLSRTDLLSIAVGRPNLLLTAYFSPCRGAARFLLASRFRLFNRLQRKEWSPMLSKIRCCGMWITSKFHPISGAEELPRSWQRYVVVVLRRLGFTHRYRQDDCRLSGCSAVLTLRVIKYSSQSGVLPLPPGSSAISEASSQYAFREMEKVDGLKLFVTCPYLKGKYLPHHPEFHKILAEEDD